MAAAVTALAGFSANATSITGSIGFDGGYTQVGGTSGDLPTATSMTINNPVIQTGSGTGTFATATLLNFASSVSVNTLTPPIGQLWSVLVGGVTYDFNVTSEAQVFSDKTAIDLQGNGVITDSLGDSANGTWQLNFGVSGDSFTWQGTSAANVPDGGMTAMLLGGALTGLGLLKRKFLA